MPSPTTTLTSVSVPAALATLIRTGVALLALAAFALSYDALRQMAAASHIHQVLTYAFPLVIDGFIAIGIGALLVLRTSPLRPRLYVSALVGIATGTSIWANVLHAVRLNEQTRRSGLALDDITVGVISAIAPLALAGAVHLYLLVQRRPTQTEPYEEPSHIAASGATTTPEPAPVSDVAPDATYQVAQPKKRPAGRPGQQPSATLEQAIEIGRTAPLGRGGHVSRRHIEKAIRDKGFGIGRERLDEVKGFLQDELDQDRVDAA
ncbi:DUF2637 domain-containing protein [Streptomyces hiroshimensis]|uniref:DUF2637 domain-containing protein n=1 Tax=Streptomyces hiroshimensis TaxID=66424 RepID=A0ABQ2Y6C2_9ACTN|nr:DUF2637 domain-containing protein [Streptomyces hiroshimensis]GGX62418.1 hypothetical protein GCM10010324_03950 [Streptomyces hiroshimensis]